MKICVWTGSVSVNLCFCIMFQGKLIVNSFYFFMLILLNLRKCWCCAGASKKFGIQRLHWQTHILGLVWVRKWAAGNICWWNQMCWLPEMCFVSWKDFCCWISLWKSKGCFSVGWFPKQNWWGNRILSCQLHFVSVCIYTILDQDGNHYNYFLIVT